MAPTLRTGFNSPSQPTRTPAPKEVECPVLVRFSGALDKPVKNCNPSAEKRWYARFNAIPKELWAFARNATVGDTNNCCRSTPPRVLPNSGIGVVYEVFNPPLPKIETPSAILGLSKWL